MRQFVLLEEITNHTHYTVDGDDFHHIVHVDRLRVGDEFPGIDPSGRRFSCTIQRIDSDSCVLKLGRIDEEDEGCSERGPVSRLPEITLFQCIPKGNKIEQIIRQTTEAGIAEIVPVQSAYSVARLIDLSDERLASKHARWNRIAREAVKQSGTERIPVIHKPISLESIPLVWNERGSALFFHQECLDSRGIHDTLADNSKRVGICIGPEGGFSTEEISLLSDAEFVPIYLGDTVLRTETAALYAVAAVRTVMLERDRWVNRPSNRNDD